MYMIDPSSLTLDIWSMTRSLTELLSRAFLWLIVLLASVGNPSRGSQGKFGIQTISAQYLLGLGRAAQFSVSEVSAADFLLQG